MQPLPTNTPLFLQPKPLKPERRALTKVIAICTGCRGKAFGGQSTIEIVMCVQEELEEIRFAYEQLDNGEGVTPKQVKVALRAMVGANAGRAAPVLRIALRTCPMWHRDGLGESMRVDWAGHVSCCRALQSRRQTCMSC